MGGKVRCCSSENTKETKNFLFKKKKKLSNFENNCILWNSNFHARNLLYLKKKMFQKMQKRMEEHLQTQYDIFSNINKEN